MRARRPRARPPSNVPPAERGGATPGGAIATSLEESLSVNKNGRTEFSYVAQCLPATP